MKYRTWGNVLGYILSLSSSSCTVCVNFVHTLCLRSLYLFIQQQIPVVTPHIWNIRGQILFLYDLLPSERASCHCQANKHCVSIYGPIPHSFRTSDNLTYHPFLSLSTSPCSLTFIFLCQYCRLPCCMCSMPHLLKCIFTAPRLQYCSTTRNTTVGISGVIVETVDDL